MSTNFFLGTKSYIATDDLRISVNAAYASCTTNCLAPLVKPLHESIGIKHGSMTTIHSYTNDQVLTDAFHNDPRRARSATMSQVPTKTGAAKGLGLVLPELDGRLDGFSMRVPTVNVSAVDLSFVPEKNTNIDEINQIMLNASKNELKDILGYSSSLLQIFTFPFSYPLRYIRRLFRN